MQEKRKFILSIISLVVVTVLFWIIWIVRAYEWLYYREAAVKLLGGLLIALATVMVASGYLVFRIARPAYVLAGRKKMMVIAICSIFCVMLFNFGMRYQFRHFGYTITAVSEIEHKESKGGKFYFQIKDSEDKKMIQFECEQNIYEGLKRDGTFYSIQYRKLNFGSRKVMLGYVDVNSPVAEAK